MFRKKKLFSTFLYTLVGNCYREGNGIGFLLHLMRVKTNLETYKNRNNRNALNVWV